MRFYMLQITIVIFYLVWITAQWLNQNTLPRNFSISTICRFQVNAVYLTNYFKHTPDNILEQKELIKS